MATYGPRLLYHSPPRYTNTAVSLPFLLSPAICLLVLADLTRHAQAQYNVTLFQPGDFDTVSPSNEYLLSNNSFYTPGKISPDNISAERNYSVVDVKQFFMPFSPALTILTAIILLSIIVGTIVGNILVCVAVCLVRKLRRPYNYLLVSLAVSDLCVAILVMPMATLYEVLGRWPFGPVLCDLWVSFDVLSCAASILNLCMISVDRYYAITKPLEYGVKRTPKRMIFCVFLVWFGAACISLPPVLILGNEKSEDRCSVCQNFGYQIYATFGSFYIPLTVMITVYYKIFKAARKIVNEERRAQSHLETHCYMEIGGVKNGGGAEAKLLGSQESADTQVLPRGSTASNDTVCSVEKNSSTIGRCFSSSQRKSNESQYPMLQQQTRLPARRSHSLAAPNNNPKRKHSTAKATRKRTTSEGVSTTHRIRSSLTSFAIKNHSNKDDSHPNTNSPHQKKLRFQLAKERKASTTLGIIMSAFIFCWLPFFVLALLRPFNDIPDTLSSVFLWLGYANSLLNPIIYATLNRDFRKPFQEILFFRCSNLNHMMREEFYYSQYGDPEQHYCAVNASSRLAQSYDEGVEIVTADGRDESFL